MNIFLLNSMIFDAHNHTSYKLCINIMNVKGLSSELQLQLVNFGRIMSLLH